MQQQALEDLSAKQEKVNKLAKHLNSAGSSSVLRLLAAAQLTDAFQLVAETEEAE